jgi:hypothetical protein
MEFGEQVKVPEHTRVSEMLDAPVLTLLFVTLKICEPAVALAGSVAELTRRATVTA